MGALTLGPLVLSLDRAYAGLGFAVLLVAAELLARRGGPEVAAWGWYAAIAAFVGARLGFVVVNAGYFLDRPGDIVAIWQGGFEPWWGVAAAAVVSGVFAWRSQSVRRVAPSVGIAAIAAWWLPSALSTPAAQLTDAVLPSVTLEALDGTDVRLDGLATVSIVNVWATWCPPCRRELPVLFDAAERHPDVAVVLVNQRESAAQVRDYLASQGFPTRGVVLDRFGVVGSELSVAGLPTTFAVDGSGRVVDVHVGEISAPALERMIARLR